MKGKRHPNSIREYAYKLALRGLNLTEIKIELEKNKTFESIPDKGTLSRWAKKGDWYEKTENPLVHATRRLNLFINMDGKQKRHYDEMHQLGRLVSSLSGAEVEGIL